MTFLDCAKAAVEHFVKVRMRDLKLFHSERHLLVSCGAGMSGIVCGWKDSPAKFIPELKALKAEHTSDIGGAIATAFDLLNMHRLFTGIDVYGQGRKPWINASSGVVVLTDGGVFCNMEGVQNTLELRNSTLYVNPAQTLTPEPYRWDQRVFCLINSLPRSVGAPPEPRNTESAKQLQKLCGETGGACYYPTSMKLLLQSIENIVDRSSFSGVTVCLKNTQNPPPKGLQTFNAQFVRLPLQKPNSPPYQYWWPLPEDFHSFSADGSMRDLNLTSISRAAHPTFLFSASDKKLSLLPSFPVDKYELENSNLTDFFLKNVKEGMCWPLWSTFTEPVKVFKNGKYNHGTSSDGKLIGFLKLSSHRSGVVNMYVLPYNFPELFTLLDDLINRFKGVPSSPWKAAFENYVRNIPFYYVTPLKAALKHMGLPNLIPEQLESVLPFQVIQQLKKITGAAKMETDRFEEQFDKERMAKNNNAQSGPASLLDIDRSKLFDELALLRAQFDPSEKANKDSAPNLRSKSSGEGLLLNRPGSPMPDDDKRFSVPIAFMGDFHNKLSASPPLREARDVSEKSLPLFGNPFFPIEKVSNRLKKDSLVLDESEDMLNQSKNSRKRSFSQNLSPPTPHKIPDNKTN